MNNVSSLDPESFQKLLARVLAAQESGMNAQSLSAAAGLLRSIGGEQLDLDEALDFIAEQARSVTGASGIAIGLLNGDQLVYRAGSGSAATYVGRRVMATVSISASSEAKEILRVENTETDTRIEGAICRQFGVKSLLILPIYHGGAVAGLLDVLFSEAHIFQDQEVRTYGLLAGLASEAISYAVQLEAKEAQAPKPSVTQHGVEQASPQIHEHLQNDGGGTGAGRRPSICQAFGASILRAGKLAALKQSAEAVSRAVHRAKFVPVYKLTWRSVSAAVLLVIVTWVVCRHYPAARSLASEFQRSDSLNQHPPLQRSVTTGNKDLDYLAGDVTVRYFMRPSAPKRAQLSHIEHYGEDVTVRYFAPNPSLMRTEVTEGEVHRISEDVTVRYFRRNNLGAQREPIGSGGQLPFNQ
jgi:GAF domain-containing protein